MACAQGDRSSSPQESLAEADLRARVAASPLLPFTPVAFAAQPPTPQWASGTVSWEAVGSDGTIYALQRGAGANPVLVLDPGGKLLRSWGRGDYTIPHSLRLDPAGNVWTVDAASSTVIKYSPLGAKLLTLDLGEQPAKQSPFNGTTDIAFGPGGHLFITDGYGNARVLEYSSTGERLRQWGQPGKGPGEFHLPHSIQIDERGTVYVADRENGRVEKFDLTGKYLGEIRNLGRVFSLQLAGPILWATIQPHDQPVTAGGWIVKLDRETGKLLGHLDVPATGGHSMALSRSGEPITSLGNQMLWFHAW